MNYFAHGMPFIDQSYVLAGTAVPDWLSVADRKVRLRPRLVQPFLDDADAVQAAVARGVDRHLMDDGWFHRTAAFFEVTGDLTRSIRRVLGTDDGFRCSFLGHITTELLLDAVLIEREPEQLDGYYNALRSVDSGRVQQAVNRMARRPTERLATFIELFVQEEFLWDYLEDERLLYRLNQVMRRIRLKPLPEEFRTVLQSGREIVQTRCRELLTDNNEPRL